MKTLLAKFAALTAVLSFLTVVHAQDAAKTTDPTNPTAKPKAAKADKPAKTKPAAKETAKEGKPYPFRGTITSVDKKAMTFTLEGKEKTRVIGMGSQSVLEKDGKPATLGQLVVGDYVHGRVEKHGEEEVVLKASVGPKLEKKAAGDEPKPKQKKKTEADEPTNVPAPAPAPAK